jgi:hypothetical protein
MPIFKPRSRSISVRLSEEEFATLQRLCVSTGARSVSDLARKAMQEILERTRPDGAPIEGTGEYYTQIRNLELKVAELAAELALFKAQQDVSEIGD